MKKILGLLLCLALVAPLSVFAVGAIAVDDEEDRKTHSTVGVVLAQLVHHGNEHRTQATTILGASGIDPPEISGWAYGRAVGISDHD